MAKKGQAVQLQQDLTSEEDWYKFLQRDGLLVVDIYSEWCGPCVAMQANLKKLKLEVGGDFLQLGMARSNKIQALKRFRENSQPTWMFIAQGKQVNLLFGSNAPALQKMILDEMKKEKECLQATRPRSERLPEDYSEQEEAAYQDMERADLAKEQMIAEKARKVLKERRIAQSKNILDSLSHVGLVLIFPHAMRKGLEIFEAALQGAYIVINKKERPVLTEAQIDEIEFFSPVKLPDASKNSLIGEKSLALMLTVDVEAAPGPIEDTILTFVYGPGKRPPGSPGSVAEHLLKSELTKRVSEKPPIVPEVPVTVPEVEGELLSVTAEKLDEAQRASKGSPKLSDDVTKQVAIAQVPVVEEDTAAEPKEEEEDIYGIWAPANDLVKGTALRYFFPLITAPLILPEPEAVPPHMAVAFDAFKRNEVFKVIDDYKEDVMNYGFFTSDECEQAQLISKTKTNYDKVATIKHGDKLVLKVSKKRSDAILAFAHLGPSHMSSNVEAGEFECLTFFPEGYGDHDAEEQEVKPADGKKRKELAEADEFEMHPEEIQFEGVVEGGVEDLGEEFEDIGGEVEIIPPMEMMTNLPEVEEDEGQGMEGEDKATSPLASNKPENEAIIDADIPTIPEPIPEQILEQIPEQIPE